MLVSTTFLDENLNGIRLILEDFTVPHFYFTLQNELDALLHVLLMKCLCSILTRAF